MTSGRRVWRTSGNTSRKTLPSTSRAGRRETRAIHSFQPTIQPWLSSTTRPMSTVSNTGPNTTSDALSNMAGGLLFDTTDEIVHDALEGGDRRQIHEERNETMNVAFLDIEIDIQEQDKLPSRTRLIDLKQPGSIAPNDGRQRHSHGPVQNIRYRCQAAIQNDVAGLGQRFLLQIDDILQGMFVADNRADQFQALGLRKNQQRPARKWPFEGLLHGDKLFRIVPLHQLRCGLSRDNLDT